MNQYGALLESEGRCILRFERLFAGTAGEVFPFVTKPEFFSQWYPFATGEMELTPGGKIVFDDGEGSAYEGVITRLEVPYTFGFREVEDEIQITLQDESEGCRMVFTHIFDSIEMAVSTAAGWHRCLDVLQQIAGGHPAEWKEDAAELRELYREKFM